MLFWGFFPLYFFQREFAEYLNFVTCKMRYMKVHGSAYMAYHCSFKKLTVQRMLCHENTSLCRGITVLRSQISVLKLWLELAELI